MSDETERQLIKEVAEMRGSSRAQHDEQMRENGRVSDALIKLGAQVEERDKAALSREEAREQRFATQMGAVMHFIQNHPSDPGAHSDLQQLTTANSTSIEEIRGQVRENRGLIDGFLAQQKTEADKRAGRKEVWGLQYRTLAVLLGLSGSPILAGLLAYFLGAFG